MRKIFILLITTLVISCKKEEKPADNHAKTEQKNTAVAEKSSAKLKLETFAFPAEVEGCSCYFAENRQEFVRQNYIYVDDFKKNAYIKVNAKTIKIPFDDSKEVSPGKKLNISVENDEFSVKIDAAAIEEGEMETTLYKGTMTISNKKTSATVTTQVYGECGC